MNTALSTERSPLDLAALDALTGGALSAGTAAERADKVRQWLSTDPELDRIQEVFRELSHRDRGAAKPLKDRMDELKRARHQDQLALEWAAKAHALLAAPRLSLGDALAWQRDAAGAGAPLSKEPLAGPRQALAERIRELEDLQHRAQVHKESAWLLVQRIEVLSTKPLSDAQQAVSALQQDVANWQGDCQSMQAAPMWASAEPRLVSQLSAAVQQVGAVWQAFESALGQALAAREDAALPLPGVPVWDDEIRASRPESVSQAESQAHRLQREQAKQDVLQALAALEKEMAEGHSKNVVKLSQELRQLVKTLGRRLDQDTEAKVHAVLAQAGELEGWQRWRADQLREKLVEQAESLLKIPSGQRPGGRKLQEALRQMREQWKSTDQGGVPNHALWKRFDEACNQLYKDVEAWLTQLRAQNEASKAQRVALMEEVRQWIAQATTSADWKAYARALHGFGERWRQSGHLSEKLFGEMQAQWKRLMQEAETPLLQAQTQSVARRQALIAEAQALAQGPLRIDAVKDVQQRWQAEAHAVPLDRRQEQKLWDAFRGPIDEAFRRKDEVRHAQRVALSAHDQRVCDAAAVLEKAADAGDASAITAARVALEQALAAPDPSAAVASAPSTAVPTDVAPSADDDSPVSGDAPVAEGASPVQPVAAPKKLVAVRGDDRPGARLQATPKAADAGRDRKPLPRRLDAERGPMRPRLGDAAFRAQRQAFEKAELALRRLASQAHGEGVTRVLHAWESRDAAALASVQGLNSVQRQAWGQALQQSPVAGVPEAWRRLEMAAQVPTPASHVAERRQLQLVLLTRRNDPSPQQTWVQDVTRVLQSAHDSDAARRLQGVLKVLLAPR